VLLKVELTIYDKGQCIDFYTMVQQP